MKNRPLIQRGAFVGCSKPQKGNPMTEPAANPPVPWHVQPLTGQRPPQAEIEVKKDQIINRQGKDFVLYAGLLDAAHKAGLQSIQTSLVGLPSEGNGNRAIVHATATFPWGSFDGIGDADAGNVSRQIQPHLIRMAETRAKARALRDALNIGMVAMEEMGPEPGEQPASTGSGAASRPVNRPDGTSSVTSTPGTRKSYGTPMTKGPAQDSRWPSGQ